jgi:hypothetical protein
MAYALSVEPRVRRLELLAGVGKQLLEDTVLVCSISYSVRLALVSSHRRP